VKAKHKIFLNGPKIEEHHSRFLKINYSFACYCNTDSYSLVCASFGLSGSLVAAIIQSTFFENHF
jgi:hypothetical protein